MKPARSEPRDAFQELLDRQVPGRTSGLDSLLLGTGLGALMAYLMAFAMVASLVGPETGGLLVTGAAFLGMAGTLFPAAIAIRYLEVGLIRVGMLPPPPDPKSRHALPAVERAALPAETKPAGPRGPWHALDASKCVLTSSGRSVSLMGAATVLASGAATWTTSIAAAPWLAPVGLTALVAGVVATASGRVLQDWEARVGVEAARPGEVVPLDIQAVAARDLWVRRVRVTLWEAEVVVETSEMGSQPTPRNTHTPHDTREVPIEAPLVAGQALRLRSELRIPADALPDRHEGPQRRTYFLRVEVDLPWLPDTYQVWPFVEITDRPRTRVPAATDQTPASLDLADLEVACPFCGEPPDGEPLVACAACDTLHHRDCWHEAATCTTYGCGETVARGVLLVSPPRR